MAFSNWQLSKLGHIWIQTEARGNYGGQSLRVHLPSLLLISNICLPPSHHPASQEQPTDESLRLIDLSPATSIDLKWPM